MSEIKNALPKNALLIQHRNIKPSADAVIAKIIDGELINFATWIYDRKAKKLTQARYFNNSNHTNTLIFEAVNDYSTR